jgi:hypothetical protein
LKNFEYTVEYYQNNKEISVLLTNSPLNDIEYFTKTQDKTVGLVFGNDFSHNMLRKSFAYATSREASEAAAEDIAYSIFPPAFGENPPFTPLNFDYEKAEFNKNLSAVAINGTFNILTCKEIIDTDLLYPVKENYERLFGVKIGFEVLDKAEYSKKLAEGNYKIAVKEISADYFGRNKILYQFPIIEDDNLNIPQIIPEETTSIPLNITTETVTESSETTIEITENTTENQQNLYIPQSDFGKIQQEILDNAYFIPLFYNSTYIYCKKNIKNVIFIPFNNVLIFKYARNFSE